MHTTYSMYVQNGSIVCYFSHTLTVPTYLLTQIQSLLETLLLSGSGHQLSLGMFYF